LAHRSPSNWLGGGASVIVNYASSQSGADEVVAAILKDGGKAVAVQADVAKSADVKRLFAATKDAFGRLDILVNNAGVFNFTALEQVTERAFLFRRGWWKRHQSKLDLQHQPRSQLRGLLRLKERGRRNYKGALNRTCRTQNPSQRDSAGHDRNRGPGRFGC
jgi:NAD(P)-dependent dehydrogenase (short-subunit alcohol dehydrogenase family)